MDEKYIFLRTYGNKVNPWLIGLVLVSEKPCSLIVRTYELNGALFEDYAAADYVKTPNASSYVFDTLEEAMAFAASKHDPCPAQGSFYAYKKARLLRRNEDRLIREEGVCIITLFIPENSERTGCYYSKKCRAMFAKVVKIERFLDDGTLVDVGKDFYSISAFYDYSVRYEVGKTVYADAFNPSKEIACTSGIHFFLKKEEAIAF